MKLKHSLVFFVLLFLALPLASAANLELLVSDWVAEGEPALIAGFCFSEDYVMFEMSSVDREGFKTRIWTGQSHVFENNGQVEGFDDNDQVFASPILLDRGLYHGIIKCGEETKSVEICVGDIDYCPHDGTPPVCGPDHLLACNSESECEDLGTDYIWYDQTCIFDPDGDLTPFDGCSADNLGACDSQQECEDEGLVWDADECVLSGDTGGDGTGDGGSSPGGDGGSGTCAQEWSCSAWAPCQKDGIQKRVCVGLDESCYDRAGTRVLGGVPETERSCSDYVCTESWVCSEWNTCSGGTQTRTCADEHACGTTAIKPALSKSCSVAAPPGPAPARVTPTPPAPTPRTPTPVVQEPESSIFDNLALLIGGPLALLLIIALISYFVWRSHHKVNAENFDEIQRYVQEEMQAGFTPEQIEDNLLNAGWQKEEIEKVFANLGVQHTIDASAIPQEAQMPEEDASVENISDLEGPEAQEA